MLRNPRGATSLRWLAELLHAGVEVHGQVVVCPGVNDGDELVRTLDDVITRYPRLGVGGAGTGGRERAFERGVHAARTHRTRPRTSWTWPSESARLTRDLFGRRTVYASDEFYLVAGIAPPGEDHYESLDQAENGVGMVAGFTTGFVERAAAAKLGSGFFQSVDGAPAWGYRAERGGPDGAPGDGPVAVLTGEYAAPLLRSLFDEHGYGDVDVVAVANTFFGGNIKVAGLLTGADLARVLPTIDPATTCLVPDVCLTEGRFLDGTTLADLPRAVTPVRTTGRDLRQALDARRAVAVPS